jgi:hypothetical protein
MKSILQDWVMELPFREQATILTGVRGCDVVPKLPYDSLPRQLAGYLRFLALNPADEREVGIVGAFFQSSSPDLKEHKMSELGHLPQHWYAHIMHAYEVCAYRLDDKNHRSEAGKIYESMTHNLHLPVEKREDMIVRLSEDRIKKGTVVS